MSSWGAVGKRSIFARWIKKIELVDHSVKAKMYRCNDETYEKVQGQAALQLCSGMINDS